MSRLWPCRFLPLQREKVVWVDGAAFIRLKHHLCYLLHAPLLQIYRQRMRHLRMPSPLISAVLPVQCWLPLRITRCFQGILHHWAPQISHYFVWFSFIAAVFLQNIPTQLPIQLRIRHMLLTMSFSSTRSQMKLLLSTSIILTMHDSQSLLFHLSKLFLKTSQLLLVNHYRLTITEHLLLFLY